MQDQAIRYELNDINAKLDEIRDSTFYEDLANTIIEPLEESWADVKSLVEKLDERFTALEAKIEEMLEIFDAQTSTS